MSRLLLCGPARRGIQPAPAPVLGTITDLSATAGVESAVLAWTPAANATSHQPQYSDDGETWANFGSALSGSADGITVTGLTASVEYSFRVIASDGSTQTISNTDTATPQAAPEWASGQWELTVDGQPGALDFDAGTVTLPVFGTLAMTADVSGESATISYTVPGVGPGSMSLTHSDDSLSGTATAGGVTVPVTGQRPPAPGQLSAGTIVALPGDEQVTISEGAAPSGGTGGPYTSSLYRSLSSGQKGTLIVPSLTLPYVDEGLVNDTAYYYVREVSDGVSTVDTPQVNATPFVPGSFAYGPGSHEPVGLKTFMSWSPAVHGTSMVAAHGSGASGAMMTGGWNWDDHMSLVSDENAPGGVAMRQHWPTGQTTRAGNAAWNFRTHTPDSSLYPGWSGQIGPLRHLYVHFQFFKESSWVNNPNNAKLIGFTMEHNDAMAGLDAYLQDMARNELWWRWQFPNNSGWANGEWEATQGVLQGFSQTNRWYDIEFYIKAQSAPGAADGELHVWVDGVKATQWYNVTNGGPTTDGTGLQVVNASASGTGYTRINVWPYYNGGSSAPKTKSEYMRWAGLYMSGA